MENGFKEFVETYGRKPELAECEIIWKDSLNTEYVNIALTDIPEEHMIIQYFSTVKASPI